MAASAWGYGSKYDVESGSLLYPGIDATENMLRWGFVRKVYGIVGTQLALTAVVAGVFMQSSGVQAFFLRSVALQILLLVGSLAALIPLYMFKDQHPHNLGFLGLWTLLMSVTVGMATSLYAPSVVLEALVLTTGVVFALTAYSFWATRRGVDFGWMGPLFATTLWVMLLWGVIQLFFHPGPVARTVYALLGALLFAGYLVLDTQLLIQRFELDDYVWASVTIYLDVINLFLHILRLVGDHRNN